MVRLKGFVATVGLLGLAAVMLPAQAALAVAPLAGTVVAQDAPPPGASDVQFEVVPATPTATPSPTGTPAPTATPTRGPSPSPSQGPLPVTGQRGLPWLLVVAVALIVLGGLIAVLARRPRRQ